MKFSKADLDDLLMLMRWRRDVRHFRDDPVSDENLSVLAQAMALAPSVGNARPWRVVRVKDPSLRARARAIFEEANAAAARGYDGARRAAYMDLKLAGMDRAPVQLAVFTHADPAEGHGLGRRTMPQTLTQSTAMAVHGMWLAARAMNLGMGMVSILDPAAIERLLDAPPDWRFFAWLCIGHPAFDDDAPLLHRADWQRNAEPDWDVR
ncbi:MAG: 5,6-dimethylbenzimidazole synthase [Rubrimonas sp.]